MKTTFEWNLDVDGARRSRFACQCGVSYWSPHPLDALRRGQQHIRSHISEEASRDLVAILEAVREPKQRHLGLVEPCG